MLEGELIFQVADALVTKSAGELSIAARNVPHTLANHGDVPARYLLVCRPAGFERHWARMAAADAGVDPPQWALQPIPEVTVVGPQIAAQARGYGRRRAVEPGEPACRSSGSRCETAFVNA